MDFPAVNELSEFWFDLFPPIFLGFISIFCFLWVLGEQNRIRIMQFFTEDKSNQHITEEGISKLKTDSTRYAFTQRIIKLFGLDSIKPLFALSLVFLFFYGINQIVLLWFQPLLTLTPSNVFYAAGVDDEQIAILWMQYPSGTLSDLYLNIIKLTETSATKRIGFLDSFRDFIRLDLSCCLILFFFLLPKRSKIRSDKKVYLRLLIFVCILLILLTCTLLTEIYQKNNEIRQMCYQAYSMLYIEITSNPDLHDDETFQYYLDQVQKDKQWAGRHLFYGAYGIRNRFADVWDFIVSIFQEFGRFLHQRTNNPYY